MPTRHYRAPLEPDGQSGYGVIFLEVEGCVSAGDGADAAVANAAEALAGHLGLLIEDGDTLPDPAPLDAPLPDRLADLRGAGEWHRALVPVPLPGQTVRSAHL